MVRDRTLNAQLCVARSCKIVRIVTDGALAARRSGGTRGARVARGTDPVVGAGTLTRSGTAVRNGRRCGAAVAIPSNAAVRARGVVRDVVGGARVADDPGESAAACADARRAVACDFGAVARAVRRGARHGRGVDPDDSEEDDEDDGEERSHAWHLMACRAFFLSF